MNHNPELLLGTFSPYFTQILWLKIYKICFIKKTSVSYLKFSLLTSSISSVVFTAQTHCHHRRTIWTRWHHKATRFAINLRRKGSKVITYSRGKSEQLWRIDRFKLRGSDLIQFPYTNMDPGANVRPETGWHENRFEKSMAYPLEFLELIHNDERGFISDFFNVQANTKTFVQNSPALLCT